jgi:cation-transporting ATPase E
MSEPIRGLTAAEVAGRLARGLGNRVRRSALAGYAEIVARNVLTLFNALVVPAALALFALGENRGALAVSGMALTNLVLGLAQEVRAKRHLDRLTLLAEARAHVLRDGRTVEVAAGDVVQDDVVLLAAGDPVLADGPVLEARFLEVDEALLTGESDPVPRRPGDRLLSGSFCVAGEGKYRAEKVGAAAFAQRTAQEARAYSYSAGPLQQSINRLIRILTGVAVVLCLAYVALYRLRGDFSRTDLVEMVAATITSMVPQGLVLMATLAFILGAVRLAARGAVVQRLEAVETMAAVDTLCLDKTGTLTTNRLKLARLEPLGGVSEEEVRRRLRLFAAASPDGGNKSLAALRDALGGADFELLDALPFKSQNRYSAVRVRAAGTEFSLALGAPEALGPLLPGDADWEAVWKGLLGDGLRLLLFAEVREPGPAAPFAGSLAGRRLVPLALLGLSDELRPEAKEVLRELARQGIAFKVLSGDHAETVRATVRPLGEGVEEPALRALAEDPVCTGDEFAAAPDRPALVGAHSVFGRVAPEQKVEVVRTLKGQGRCVAMIGDGVNDVLPIKNATLGVAMGAGSRAARTVAGLVLESDDFRLLPQALEEGRTILRNLRRAGKLFLVKNVFTVLLIVGALGVLGLPFPYQPQQVTLLNSLTIGVPALLIMLSRERSAAPSGTGFVREVGWFALRTGVVLGVAGLIVMWLAWHDAATAEADLRERLTVLSSTSEEREKAAQEARELRERLTRTALLLTLIPLGLVNLLRVLHDGEDRPLAGDWRFHWFTAAAVLAFLAALYVPPLAFFFDLEPPGWRQWGLVLAVVGPACLALWLSDRLGWRRV